jgi:hypothetical protein
MRHRVDLQVQADRRGAMKLQLALKGKPIDGTISTLLVRRGEWTEATMTFKLTGKEVANEITFFCRKAGVARR